MPIIHCLQQMISSGAITYPVYVGFLPAHEILDVAEAPSFTEKTSNADIATNILNPPTKEWQRPINQSRVSVIAGVYNNTGELMPNPVLLSENTFFPGPAITVRQEMAATGAPTRVWLVDVPNPAVGQQKPLWILDGQHRINGLATSAQRNNFVPLVLLLNLGTNAFSASHLAKLFAQVTTEATKLDDLHNEWLTFAFGLSAYSPASPVAAEHRKSMEVVARLCSEPDLKVGSSSISNPFFNNIRFKVVSTSHNVGPAAGGFAYDCIELKELIRANYYSATSAGPHLSPQLVAQQIGLAYVALQRKVAVPQSESVFFGTGTFGQRIMQDAFLVGVLAYLREHNGPPAAWEQLLEDLEFPRTDWNFHQWTITLNGQAASNSRNVARKVFEDVFRRASLPSKALNLADFLRGSRAEVEFVFSQVTGTGRPSKVGQQTQTLMRGDVASPTITPRKHVVLKMTSLNISKVTITSTKSRPGKELAYPELLRKSGLVLDNTHDNPLSLVVEMEHYGGVKASAQISVRW